MDEATLAATSPAQHRLCAAEYFLKQYELHSGPPVDSYAKMVYYFDAFLGSLASIWDMSDATMRQRLEGIDSFRFFFALRNVSIHSSILAVDIPGNREPRPFAREITLSLGAKQEGSSRLRFRMDILTPMLDDAEKRRKTNKEILDTARRYITQLEATGKPSYLDEVMANAVREVQAVLSDP